MRKPAVAGRFYPADAAALKKQLSCFIDTQTEQEDVIGVVSPHAGYVYSGLVAGRTFSKVKLPDTAIIIGPNHSGSGRAFSIVGEGIWQTPLGDVRINSQLAKLILDKSENLSEDSTAHIYEHSLEVQLPFLQYLKNDITIVPIILSRLPAGRHGLPAARLPAGRHGGETAVYKEVGRAIASSLRELNSKAIIVASSDMTHDQSQDVAVSQDKQAIEAIMELDEDKLVTRVEELNISMCGCAPVAALICAAKKLGATQGTLVKYQTSGEVTGDYNSVVGYAGIVIK